MKKLAAVAFAVVLGLSATSCDDDSPPPPEVPDEAWVEVGAGLDRLCVKNTAIYRYKVYNGYSISAVVGDTACSWG